MKFTRPSQIAASTLAACLLAACGGGGGGGNSNPSSNANGVQPYTTAYNDFNAAAGISATAWTGASVVDNNPTKSNAETLTQSGWTGQITYGVASKPAVLAVSNAAVANLGPLSVTGSTAIRIFDPYGLGAAPLGTPAEPNLDGAYEICGPATSGSISDNGFAATDVIVQGSATRVTSATELAGQSFRFNQYCDPANQANPQTLSFDASGNATFELYTGSTNSGSLTPTSVSAADFQASMNGTPYGNQQQGQVIWTVYRFVTASNALKYVVIERGSADGNYIGIWY